MLSMAKKPSNDQLLKFAQTCTAISLGKLPGATQKTTLPRLNRIVTILTWSEALLPCWLQEMRVWHKAIVIGFLQLLIRLRAWRKKLRNIWGKGIIAFVMMERDVCPLTVQDNCLDNWLLMWQLGHEAMSMVMKRAAEMLLKPAQECTVITWQALPGAIQTKTPAQLSRIATILIWSAA